MSTPTHGLGATRDAAGVARLLDHVLRTNLQTPGPPTPVCVWGTHGIGKTALVEDFARSRGWGFVYLAPAQFEEMGDLHGLPVSDGDKTRFAAPEWVPTQPGPGILLLDDVNRADDRILRGLMPLLQRGEMMSWRLPPGWQIVATANPEGGDYSVTPMDEAILTRFLHVTMVFEARAWARWALAAGVDPRGVSFVLTYPESVTGRRTTPRTLTQFFAQIRPISDLVGEAALVHALGCSALDESTLASFVAFARDGLASLLEPAEILDASDFAPVAARLATLGKDTSGTRIDRLATIGTRLYLEVTRADYTPAPRHGANLVAFLMDKTLPADLRAMLHRDLTRDGGPAIREMLRDKRLAALVLAAV